MASLPIPDEILAEIFLRAPASDPSRPRPRLRRLRLLPLAGRSFLRQYRRLHAPPLLGFLDEDQTFNPAVPPHPSAPAASAVAADFSFSFLPAPARGWAVQDSRDGRVLLERPRQRDASDRIRAAFPETAVCDPLHRRYLLLPPIPDDMAAPVEDSIRLKSQRWPETFLVPPGDHDVDEAADADDTLFRVICMAQGHTRLFAFVFSSSTGQWRALPSRSWSDLLPGLLRPLWSRPLYSRQYACGCFYWMVYPKDERMLVLDIPRMEFSIAELPPEAKDSHILGMTMAEAGDGRPGMFVLANDATDLIYTTIRRCNGGTSSQWMQSEKKISLGSGGYLFTGSMGRYLLLYWWGRSSLESCHFTLDTRTFQLEKVCASSSFSMYTYSNFPCFPPLFSSPTISSGFPKGAEKAVLERDAGVLQARIGDGAD